MAVLSKTDIVRIKEIDSSVKNKFSFSWLERTVTVGEISVQIGDDFKKIDVPGQAICQLCSKQINYGSRGAVALEDHAKSAKHVGLLKQRQSTHQIDKLFNQYKDDSEEYNKPQQDESSSTKPAVGPSLVPMCDRISNAEALLLTTMAEHSLPFTLAPVLTDLSKTLAEDPKALAHLSMDRTTASYKLTYGVAETFKQRIVRNMQQTPFSLNIDESTSSNDKRVLAVLVSFYNSVSKTVVCEHLQSIELIKVNAESIYNVIVDLIETNDIPWSNLISILMDSCSVMRGKKSGVETRLRNEKAPHLLDIDGHSCHHIHNACKRFCNPFQKYLELLFIDLHNDFQFSSDQKQLLFEICELLEIKYTTPERFLEHRWLSAYDVALSTDILFDAYIVCYHSFLGKEDKTLYMQRVLEIYKRRNVKKEARERLFDIRSELSKKSMTDLGKKRKQRITEKLFHTDTTTKLYLAFYEEVLPVLKDYVMTFQTADVMVHQLHDRQLDTFTKFLACFVKAEYVANKSGKALKNLVLDQDDGQFMNIKDMFVGGKVSKLMKELSNDDKVVSDFLNRASAAYLDCAKHMQKTLPLDSAVLKSLSCIDPVVRNHSTAVKGLKRLTGFYAPLLTEEDSSTVLKEITSYSVDRHLPEVSEDVVKWWTEVKLSNRYPVLSKVVMGALSIFHGPRVESTFNVMGDVIHVKAGRTNIETYSSIQTVKYALKARKTTALKMFRRKDVRFSPVDRNMCIKLKSAGMKYKEKKNMLQTQKLQRQKHFSVSKGKSKTAMKRKLIEDHDLSYAKHLKVEAQRVKKRIMTQRLNELCAKRKGLGK